MRSGRISRAAALSAALVAALVAAGPYAAAQTAQQQDLMQSLDFEQKLDGQVPLDATFVDEAGREVRLGQYFGERPVILTLVYYECPMLCTEILNGTLHMMKELEFSAGEEFDVVTISIDPRETPALAAEKRDYYVRRYAREGAADGWHFLVGSEEQTRRVADAVGFGYRYDPETDEYAHPSGIVVLTPGGKISRYFYGVQYDGTHVRLGLVEASANKIGSPVDKLLLFCYHYDPTAGKYNVAIMRMIQVFGAVFVVLMAAGFVVLRRSEKKNEARPEKPGLPAQG